jgi:hypothetical protein
MLDLVLGFVELELIASNTLFKESNLNFFCMKNSSSPDSSRHRMSSQKVDSACQLLKKFFAKSRGQQGFSSCLPFLFESTYIRTEGILRYNEKILEGISSDQKGGVGTHLFFPFGASLTPTAASTRRSKTAAVSASPGFFRLLSRLPALTTVRSAFPPAIISPPVTTPASVGAVHLTLVMVLTIAAFRFRTYRR